MKTIYKYPLLISSEQQVELPEGVECLSVQIQRTEACLWALVDPKAPIKPRTVLIYGTGHPVHADGIKYISTFQMAGGDLVFHVFIKQ